MSKDCNCPGKTCHPEQNEGCVCWRSGLYIPRGYFEKRNAESEGVKHGD